MYTILERYVNASELVLQIDFLLAPISVGSWRQENKNS